MKHFFHLFDLAVANAHILHTKTSKKNMSLEIFNKKFTKGLLARAGAQIQVQGQTSSSAGRLVWRDHSIYRIPATPAKLERKSQSSCHVGAEYSKHQTGKSVK
jgi:hypothetical protein